MATELREWQPRKALRLIDVRLAGRAIERSAESAKARSPIQMRLSGRATERRESQFAKADGPIEVRLAGRVTWMQASHNLWPFFGRCG